MITITLEFWGVLFVYLLDNHKFYKRFSSYNLRFSFVVVITKIATKI